MGALTDSHDLDYTREQADVISIDPKVAGASVSARCPSVFAFTAGGRAGHRTPACWRGAAKRIPTPRSSPMGAFRNRHVTETRNAVAARSRGQRVRFVDRAGWVDPATDRSDNVHPTDVGHAKTAQRLRPILDQHI
jgi:hypothetical protein